MKEKEFDHNKYFLDTMFSVILSAALFVFVVIIIVSFDVTSDQAFLPGDVYFVPISIAQSLIGSGPEVVQSTLREMHGMDQFLLTLLFPYLFWGCVIFLCLRLFRFLISLKIK